MKRYCPFHGEFEGDMCPVSKCTYTVRSHTVNLEEVEK